jgi:hypothetical protein
MRPTREMLPNFDLERGTSLGSQFLLRGERSFHAAARHVQRLPYGRNSDRTDYGLVLAEGRGTCSTKHALLAALAREHARPVELRLGIYEMDEENTPGVGSILGRYGLACMPEAHCFLAHRGVRVDLTRDEPTGSNVNFLHEETIEPVQIGSYKVGAHRRFIEEWASQRKLDPEQVWKIREECILALSDAGYP